MMNAFTGPWRIIHKLHGSSYEVEHMKTHTITKRYAAHLSLFPLELVTFEPVDGTDKRFGKCYTPIQADPYSDSVIKGFIPPQSFKESQLDPALTGLTSSSNIIFPSC